MAEGILLTTDELIAYRRLLLRRAFRRLKNSGSFKIFVGDGFHEPTFADVEFSIANAGSARDLFPTFSVAFKSSRGNTTNMVRHTCRPWPFTAAWRWWRRHD